MGIKFVNRSSTHTHTHKVPPTPHGHSIPQHLFDCIEYKTTLTGALSTLVELSRWNVYLYIQIAQCHVMSHNVSWTNNVSHFSIRPAALKPPCSFYGHSKQPDTLGAEKGPLCDHCKVPVWIKSLGCQWWLNQHCTADTLLKAKGGLLPHRNMDMCIIK